MSVRRILQKSPTALDSSKTSQRQVLRPTVNTVGPDLYSKARNQITPISSTVEYMNTGISFNGVEYPIPQALYLVRLSKLVNKLLLSEKDVAPHHRSLLNLLTKPRHNQAKEISEAFASAEGLDRLRIKYFVNASASNYDQKETPRVKVYVLGDGKEPLGAAAISLQFAECLDWEIFSIDPLAEGGEIGNVKVFKGFSQDFEIPDTSHNSEIIHVVIACHSHAPLQEFYDRLKGKKRCCVAIPCCSQFCDLKEGEVDVYDDFEVYSGKRKVWLYADGF